METTTNTSEDMRVKQLTGVLYLLQLNLEEFSTEVDKSYQLFTQIGEKTELVESIEKMLNNPLGNLSNLSEKIDEQINFIVDKIVKGFFANRKDLLAKVLRSNTSLNNLHYSIVLKDDNMDNRLAIFDFLSSYSALDISSKFPVYFQFVPMELSGKINFVEEVQIP